MFKHKIDSDQRLVKRGASYLADDAFRCDVLGKIKLGRLGLVEGLMGATVFLAGDAVGRVTGSAVMINGGSAVGLMIGSAVMIDGGWTAGRQAI